MSRRDRRNAMLSKGPPYPNVTTAKSAYRSGRLSRDDYEDTIWVLKVIRKNKIRAAKLDYENHRITKDQYRDRVRQIDQAYDGR